MKIHKPEIKQHGERVRVSSYIEVDANPELTKNLWFEFDKKYAKYISGSPNGFVAATTLFAMCLNENIVVQGKISPKLHYGLKQLQGYFNFWNPEDFDFWRPKKFHKIKIASDGYHISKFQAKSVGSSFTGGVDSFYTLYNHTSKKEPNQDYRITHCIMVDNGTRPLYEISEQSYPKLKNKYKKFLAKQNIEFMTVTTNIEEFFGGVISGNETHATTILGISLILDKLFHRFYIPSSYNYADQIPWGSNPVTDALLSTETLDIIHHGCEKNRVAKTLEITQYEESYDNLRVCWNTLDTKNCGKCSKCIRTMLALEMGGKLSKYSTFLTPLTRRKVRNWNIVGTDKTVFARGVIDHARNIGRDDIVSDVKTAIRRTRNGERMQNLGELKGKWISNTLSKAWSLLWAPSAHLKRRSNAYAKLVRNIKNDYP